MKIHNLTRKGNQWLFTIYDSNAIFYTDLNGNGLYVNHPDTGECQRITDDFKSSRCKFIMLLKLNKIF